MLSFDSGGGSVKQPATVFFTFQFYRFPQVTTERYVVDVYSLREHNNKVPLRVFL